MDGPRDDHILISEVSQKEKDKYHVVSLTCGIESTTRTYPGSRSNLREIAKGEGVWGRMDWGLGSAGTNYSTGWIHNKV